MDAESKNGSWMGELRLTASRPASLGDESKLRFPVGGATYVPAPREADADPEAGP